MIRITGVIDFKVSSVKRIDNPKSTLEEKLPIIKEALQSNGFNEVRAEIHKRHGEKVLVLIGSIPHEKQESFKNLSLIFAKKFQDEQTNVTIQNYVFFDSVVDL